MSLMPSFKTMGIWGAVLAVLAYLFRDNPMIQGLMEMFTGPKDQPKEKPQTAAGGASSAGGGAAPKAEGAEAAASAPAQTPQQQAAQVMQQWKQTIQEQNLPPSVQQAIMRNEAQYQAQFEQALSASRTPEQAQQALMKVQVAALSEATKQEFSDFREKTEQQVKKSYDAIIREVNSNGDLSDKERTQIVKTLRKEKEATLKAMNDKLDKLPPEKRVEMALNPTIQEKDLQNHAEALQGRQEAVSKDVKSLALNNNALSWASTGLGLVSGVAGLVSLFPPATMIALPISVATGMAAGGCQMYNHSGSEGSTLQFALGGVQAGVSALPIVGALTKGGTALFKSSASIASTSSNPLKVLGGATVAEGRAIMAVESVTGKAFAAEALAAPHEQAVAGAIKNFIKGDLKALEALTDPIQEELAKKAMTKFHRSDFLTGQFTNGWRATNQVLASIPDPAIGEISPTRTPEVKTPAAERKTSLPI